MDHYYLRREHGRVCIILLHFRIQIKAKLILLNTNKKTNKNRHKCWLGGVQDGKRTCQTLLFISGKYGEGEKI